MIVEFKENVRTLRGKDTKRKYRYTRRVLLKCEICGATREVNCTRKIQESHTHLCKTCSTKRLGKLNKGRVAWNNKKRKISSDIKVGSLFVNSSGYIEVYVGNAFCKKQRKDKYRLLHKLVAQAKKGSHLDKHELVHHVDGDRTNNNPDNLFVCKSKAHHQDIHTQLEQLSMSLVKAGIIQFNHQTGEYHLPHLKEILNEYSVNSEETYVLEIDSLGNMAILSQQIIHIGNQEDSMSTVRNIIILHNGYVEIKVKSTNYSHTVFLDTEDLGKVGKVRISNTGYAYTCKKGISVSHLVLDYKSNTETVVDHINGNTLDNRKANLRIVSQRDNNHNKHTFVRNNTGTIGISYRRNGNYEYYRASVSEYNPRGKNRQGQRHTKQFNINKLGKEEAFQLANEWLEKKKQELGYRGATTIDLSSRVQADSKRGES